MRRGERVACRSRGFTYLALLWWVAISGVMLAALGSQWRLDATREREAELVFRGEQIQAALAAYQANTPAGQPALPKELVQLLDDLRQVPAKRHLRRLWSDPITGKDWGLLRTESGGIRGVFSASGRKPLTAPEGVTTYREWLFEVGALQLTQPGASDADAPMPGASKPASANSPYPPRQGGLFAR